MFDKTSRYFGTETSTAPLDDGAGGSREARFAKRRFIPPAEGALTLVEHTVAQGERLDNIAARYIGDPTQFWRVCDANNAMRPNELTETVGRIIKVALAAF